MWIMHRTLGRWPSLEPTKNNLRETIMCEEGQKVTMLLIDYLTKNIYRHLGRQKLDGAHQLWEFTNLEAAIIDELRPP